MELLRVLAVAAGTGRLAYVFFVGDELKDWRISDTAAKSSKHAAGFVQGWINLLLPDVVVSEKTERNTKKGEKTSRLISTIAQTAEQNHLLDIAVVREHEYQNKYEEAEAIASQYPELKSWLPKKRRFFENEPRGIVLFEAIALAEKVVKTPAASIAAKLG